MNKRSVELRVGCDIDYKKGGDCQSDQCFSWSNTKEEWVEV